MPGRTPTVLARLALALVLAGGVPAAQTATSAPTGQDYVALYRQAMDAYQKKDLAAFLSGMEGAVALAPDHPTLLIRLAAARALNGNRDGAMDLLGRLARMQLKLDLSGPDFESVRSAPGYTALADSLRHVEDPIQRSSAGFSLPERDLLAEGIARDPVTGSFFVGSVHRRLILSVDPAGVAHPFVTEGRDGLWGVLGMAVDAERRILWACSSAVPQMKGGEGAAKGRAALFAFHVETGALRGRYPLEGADTAHNCNDLSVARDGTVYVSDAAGGGLHRLAPGGDGLQLLIEPGRFRSPQGLALSRDERTLYVADYSLGLRRVDLATKEVTVVAGPPDTVLRGIDGLVRHADRLIAIQNGIPPHRVVALALDAAGASVTTARILEMNNPAFDEPTLGVFAGDDFYFVANSQWERFAADGTIPEPDRLSAPLVLKMSLR